MDGRWGLEGSGRLDLMEYGTIWAVIIGVWRCGERYILIGREGVFFKPVWKLTGLGLSG
mgnify:CR=1 FL=1